MLIKIFKFNCTDYYRSKNLNNCDLLNKFLFKSTKLFLFSKKKVIQKMSTMFVSLNSLLIQVNFTVLKKSKQQINFKNVLFFWINKFLDLKYNKEN